MVKLQFSRGNAKLHGGIATFSLPAGYTCPFADKCLAYTDKETGKLTDGPNSEFRCFSASQEAVFPNVRRARWHNFDALRGKSLEEMTEILSANVSIIREPKIRIHVAGDFFSENYFLAWVNVAKKFKGKIFYAYTKSLPFWVKHKDILPKNFRLVASEGGKKDELILAENLKSAKVVYSKEDAKSRNLPIDHDDSHAYSKSQKSFALLIHGVQKAGSLASKAVSALRAEGKGGYAR